MSTLNINNYGFSILELLTCIAIISSICCLSFGSYKQLSNNLKQNNLCNQSAAFIRANICNIRNSSKSGSIYLHKKENGLQLIARTESKNYMFNLPNSIIVNSQITTGKAFNYSIFILSNGYVSPSSIHHTLNNNRYCNITISRYGDVNLKWIN